MSRGEAPAQQKGKIMEIINNATGERWTNVKVRDLRKIRRLIRKEGYSDSRATWAVLGIPTHRPDPQDNWLAEAEVAMGLSEWDVTGGSFTSR